MTQLKHHRRKYEYICEQLAKEDQLYQNRLNMCIIVNLALCTAAFSQVREIELETREFLIMAISSAVGFMITRGLHQMNRLGGAHVSGLRSQYEEINLLFPDRFPRPYFTNPAAAGFGWFGRLTGIPIVFQFFWITVLIAASFLYLAH